MISGRSVAGVPGSWPSVSYQSWTHGEDLSFSSAAVELRACDNNDAVGSVLKTVFAIGVVGPPPGRSPTYGGASGGVGRGIAMNFGRSFPGLMVAGLIQNLAPPHTQKARWPAAQEGHAHRAVGGACPQGRFLLL